MITLADASELNKDVPDTVITPLSVIPLPPLIDRSPFTVNVPRFNAVVPLSIVTSPELPAVAAETAPVNALLSVLKVIVALLALVVKDDVPVTARATFCVILPVVAVTLRLPPTAPPVLPSMNRSPFALAEESKSTAALSTNVILPNVPDPAAA